MYLSIIVPVHNEAATIEELYARCRAVLEARQDAWEFIVVDDGSSDDSGLRAELLAQAQANVKVIRHRQRLGKSFALASGFAAAKGDVAVTIDGDLQDVPEMMPRLLEKIGEGADLVAGRRVRRQDSALKRVLSYLFNAVLRLLRASPLHDNNCGLKVYRRAVYTRLSLWGGLHRLTPVIARRMGFSVAEVEIDHEPRRHGRSCYSLLRLSAAEDLLAVMLCGADGPQPQRDFSRAAAVCGSFALIAGISALFLLDIGQTVSALIMMPFVFLGAIVAYRLVLRGRSLQRLVEGEASGYRVMKDPRHSTR
jgi:hypothetical protein